MLEIVVNPDRTHRIPLVGTYVAYQDKEYQVLRTTTYQEQDPDNALNVIIGTNVELLETSDQGDDLGKPIITVDADETTDI